MVDHLLIGPKPIPMDHNFWLISKHFFQLLEELLPSEVPSSPQPQSFSLHQSFSSYSPSPWMAPPEVHKPLRFPQSWHLCILIVTTAYLHPSRIPTTNSPTLLLQSSPPWRSKILFLIHKSHWIAPLLKRRSLASCDSQDNVQIP